MPDINGVWNFRCDANGEKLKKFYFWNQGMQGYTSILVENTLDAMSPEKRKNPGPVTTVNTKSKFTEIESKQRKR